MSKSTPKPTAAELDLLRILWQIGPSSVKDVHTARVAARPDSTHANVLRLMQIMHGKGLLTRDESLRSHTYAAAQPQESLQTNLLKDLITRVFGGSGKDLVMAALQEHVNDQDREEIKRYLKGPQR